MQKIIFFAALLLPALLLGQVPADTMQYNFPVIIGNAGTGTQRTAWTLASSVVIDRKTDSLNRIAIYAQQKVKRDTAMPVIISHDSIRQDNKIVGYFRFSSGTSSVYSPGGLLIASATNIDDRRWNIRVFSEGIKRELSANGFFEQDIAEYLIRQGYL